MVIDLLAGVPEPTAEVIKAVRRVAAHSQAEAVSVIGLARAQTWSDYEAGRESMPRIALACYMLATGQHPSHRLTPKLRG